MPTKSKRARAHANRTAHRRAVARRRQFQERLQERHEVRTESRRRLRKRALVVGGGMVVIAAVVLTILWWPTPKPKIELTGTLVSPTSDPLVITSPPDVYKVDYQFDVFSSSGNTSHYQQLAVQRPFNDQVVFYAGQAATGTSEYKGISNLGLTAASTTGGPYEIRNTLPGPSQADVRFDIVLDDLVNDGYYVRGARRQLLGRECTVFRTGRTVENSVVEKPTDKDWADICIDDHGLVLEEVAVSQGKLSLRVAAISVDVQPALKGDEFVIVGSALTASDGSPELAELDLNASPTDGFIEPAHIPDGFEHKGRYRYGEPPSAQESGAGLTATKDSYVDVYVNGTQVLIIGQGAVEKEPQTDRSGTEPITIDGWGDAQLQRSVHGPTIYGLKGTTFLHVSGTLAIKDLQAIATTLQ